jgi:hypothetical protein
MENISWAQITFLGVGIARAGKRAAERSLSGVPRAAGVAGRRVRRVPPAADGLALLPHQHPRVLLALDVNRHSDTALYISLVILYAKCTGWRQTGFNVPAQVLLVGLLRVPGRRHRGRPPPGADPPSRFRPLRRNSSRGRRKIQEILTMDRVWRFPIKNIPGARVIFLGAGTARAGPGRPLLRGCGRRPRR